MTEFEQQLLKNLTGQLDTYNKIELKRMQNESLTMDSLNRANIDYLKAKTKFYQVAFYFMAELLVITLFLGAVAILNSMVN